MNTSEQPIAPAEKKVGEISEAAIDRVKELKARAGDGRMKGEDLKEYNKIKAEYKGLNPDEAQDYADLTARDEDSATQLESRGEDKKRLLGYQKRMSH